MRLPTYILIALTIWPSLGLCQKESGWLRETGWTKVKWTADLTPYRQVEAKAMVYWRQPDAKALVARLKDIRGIEKPSPLQAFERLFLEVLRYLKLKSGLDSEYKKSLLTAHRYGDYSSYAMTRLRFVAQGHNYFGTALEPLGERLLQQYANDADVARVLAQILSVEFRDQLAKQKRAVALAKMVYEKDGKQTGDLGLYGECAYQTWALDKNRETGTLAKDLLTRYMSSPEAGPIFLPSFRRYLQQLQASGIK